MDVADGVVEKVAQEPVRVMVLCYAYLGHLDRLCHHTTQPPPEAPHESWDGAEVQG